MKKTNVGNKEIAVSFNNITKRFGSVVANKGVTFDVYKGEHVQQGYKSVALTMTFVDPTKTLVDATINELFNNLEQMQLLEVVAPVFVNYLLNLDIVKQLVEKKLHLSFQIVSPLYFEY